MSASPRLHHAARGFTLLEVLIGVTLALMMLTAVLVTYVGIGRNFTRSLGLSSANQPSLESQARRTLATFAQDVRMATGVSGTPSASSLTLVLATSTGTTTVAYSYNSSTGTLTRTPSAGTASVLHYNLLSLYFRYYDSSGNPFDSGASPYTTITTYALAGIKQVSVNFSSQGGSSTNGTLTQVYQTSSQRLLIRNNTLLQ